MRQKQHAVNADVTTKTVPKVPPFEATPDALLNCLMLLTHHFHVPMSAEALVAGLPLEDARLTLPQFARAAGRAGLRVRIVKRDLAAIDPHVLPVVLTSTAHGAVVLMRLDAGQAFLKLPNGTDATLTQGELEADYAGTAVFVKPRLIPGVETLFHAEVKASWFWQTMRDYWRLWVQVGVAAVLINLFGLVSPLYIMNVYDRVVPNQAFATLWVLSLGALLVAVFEFALRLLRGYFIDVAGKGADVLLSARLFEQAVNVKLGARATSSGAFASNLREFETIREFFTSATLATLIDLPFVVLFIFIIALVGGPLALVPLLAVPVMIGLSFLVQIPLGSLMKTAFADMAARHGHLVETLAGLETVKSINAEGEMQRRWEHYVGISARLGMKARFYAALAQHAAVFMQALVSVLVMIWGVYLIAAGDMSMGALVAATMLASRAMAPLAQVAGLYTRFHQARESLKALNSLMDQEVERPGGVTFLHRPRLSGAIELKDVSFGYPATGVSVIDRSSLTIKPGEKIGVIGRTGSGKSTLARLLLNLYSPTAGSVLMDGTDIRQIDPSELRQQISLVPQNITLFRGSLRDNLRLGNRYATDAQVAAALQVAGLSSFIAQHPKGVDLDVGERGESVSGGQRQAIALARALLHGGHMIVMDEPTSSMDQRTEEQVISNLRTALQGKTVIVITHRASLLALVDRLVIMDHGTLVAEGPRDAVLERLNRGDIKVSRE